MDALVAAQEDIKYGHLTAQKEEESIEQLLDRITYKAQ